MTVHSSFNLNNELLNLKVFPLLYLFNVADAKFVGIVQVRQGTDSDAPRLLFLHYTVQYRSGCSR